MDNDGETNALIEMQTMNRFIPKRIIVIGPPGSGKSSIANSLSMRHNVPDINLGDLVRAEAISESTLGKTIKARLDAGELVSDEILCTLVSRKLAKPECKNGFIMDGFPKNINQCELMRKTFNQKDVDHIFLLYGSDLVFNSRIGQRVNNSHDYLTINIQYHKTVTPLLNELQAKSTFTFVDAQMQMY